MSKLKELIRQEYRKRKNPGKSYSYTSKFDDGVQERRLDAKVRRLDDNRFEVRERENGDERRVRTLTKKDLRDEINSSNGDGRAINRLEKRPYRKNSMIEYQKQKGISDSFAKFLMSKEKLTDEEMAMLDRWRKTRSS